MHNNWEEMIPFYIAGTLPKPDTSRLENHLATCDECRTSLEEWRAIATAVRSDAASQMRDLPPLSANVLNIASQRSSGRSSSPEISPFSARPTTHYRATSVTLIAAVFTVILFGGVLAFMLRGTQPKQGDVVLLPTQTASVTLTPEITQQMLSATPEPNKTTPSATREQPQIIVVEPSITPSPSLVFNTPSTLVFNTPIIPTLSFPTAVAPNIIQPTQNPPNTFEPLIFATGTPENFAQTMMLGMGGGPTCTIKAAILNSAVNLYAGPGTNYPAVNTFSGDDELIVLSKSDNGWYQAQYTARNNQWVGWVRQELVYTIGVCDDLPMIAAADYQNDATATAIPPIVDPPAVTIMSDGINLRGGPGTNYPIVGSAQQGENYHIEARSGSGSALWYLVTIPGERSAWVFGTLVQLSPANAIIAPAATIPPSPMPTASAAPPLPSATVGPNVVAGRWSQTITVLATTCLGGVIGTSTTTPVSLMVGSDSITLSYADAGTPFTLIRGGDRTYMGGYSTASNSVNVTLTFTSSTGYNGTATTTQNDGCTVQSAWNGLYQGS
jgi:uncharacterized protein YgiM (DUF1202 family)